MSRINEYRKELRHQPRTLFRKPWILLFVPLIIANALIKRIPTRFTKIYLTDTSISELKPHSCQLKSGYHIIEIKEYKSFREYSEKRMLEDLSVDKFYKFEVKDRFDKGDFAFIYINDKGQPASYLFICTSYVWFSQVSIQLPLPENTFGLYDVYTFKSFRKRGFYKNLFYGTIIKMEAKGFKRLWLWLMAHNKKSLNVHQNLGLTTITKILIQRISYGLIKRKILNVEIPLSELIDSNE